MQLRTQIYLKPFQHAALLKEARRLGLSLAGLIRKLADDHVLKRGEGELSAQERKKAALSLVGLGRSGFTDVSQRTDAYLGHAIYEEMVREKTTAYKTSGKKPKKKRA